MSMRLPILHTLLILVLLTLIPLLPSLAADNVQININPETGSSGSRPAPTLPSLISSIEPAPDSDPSSPRMETTEEKLMRQLREALPSMSNLHVPSGSANVDFQQLLMGQFARDEEATRRARSIPRPRGLVNLTLAELWAHNGRDADAPIYLSIKRRLYDVTDGVRWYGQEGGKYKYLSGREVGRALISGCFESTGLTYDVRGVGEEGERVIDMWQRFYGKKYRFAGYLKGKKVDPDSPVPDDDCPEAEKYAGRPHL